MLLLLSLTRSLPVINNGGHGMQAGPAVVMGIMGDLPIAPSLRSDHQHSLHVFHVEEKVPEICPISEQLRSLALQDRSMSECQPGSLARHLIGGRLPVDPLQSCNLFKLVCIAEMRPASASVGTSKGYTPASSGCLTARGTVEQPA